MPVALIHRLVQLMIELLVVLTGCGVAYHLVSILAALRFRRSSAPAGGAQPAVSVLKPVRGVDPQAYENYASFCRQTYGQYEVLFGVQDPTDPAIELIQQLRAEFPDAVIRLVISGDRVGTNLKVCNLHNMLREAQNEILVISDSDMRVRPEYLAEVTGYFADPRVGLVTSPYRGAEAHSVPAGLEALGIGTDFFPGVAVATQFGEPNFGLGSTLALRRETLEQIGGFEGIADYLADDFQLGNRVSRLGLRVVLSRYIVDTVLPNVGFGPMFARRLRWMRTARTCQPLGFAGSAITHSTVWTLLLALLSGFHPWAVELLMAQQAVRIAAAAIIGAYVLQSRGVWRWFWLLLASDVLNFLLWAGSWCGNTVQWRGDRYRLTEGGRMERITGYGVVTAERAVHS